MAPFVSLPPTSLAPSLPSLALDLPLDDAIDILKRRQAHHQSAPVLPPATPLKHAVLAEKDSTSHFSSTMSSTSWGRVTSKESISHRMPSRQRAIKVLKSKNLLVSTSAPRLPMAQPIREDIVEQAPMPAAEELQKTHAKLPKLSSTKRSNRDSIGPLPPNWRPSSKGQTVSRAAAAAFWGITLEDGGSDLGDEEDFQGSTGFHRRSSQKAQTEFPLAALHAATSVPLSDLKEACGIFGRFVRSDSEDITEAHLDMKDFESLLCHVTGVQDASELAPEFLKSAFHTADRNYTGDIDIWEFVTWYSAFSFSEAVCVNKFARETRDVARKHGMNILNIERYKKAFDRYDLNSNGVIEFSEFKNIISDLLKIPTGLDLPQERVMSMWRNADKDGSGSIDFEEFVALLEEFVAFYVKVFGDTFETDFDPVADYYRSMRRIQ